MKIRIFTGIEHEHLIVSALYVVVGIALMAASIPTGVMKGSSLGVFLFNIGLIVFLFALTRPWRNAKYYFIQFVLIFLIFSIVEIASIFFFKDINVSEGFLWFVGGICIDGFIASLIGVIAFSEGYACLLYSADCIVLFAMFILFPQVLSPDRLNPATIITSYVFLMLQFATVAVFFYMALNEARRNSYSRLLILIFSIILISMGMWGLLKFKPMEWMFAIHIWSVLEIIGGIFSISAFVKYDEGLTES